MKIIKNSIENAEKILNKKKLSDEAHYRLSQFAFQYTKNGRYLLQNMMTCEVIELNAEEWCAVEEIKNSPQGYSFLEKHGLTELAVKRYLVESDYDEVKYYKQTCFLLKTMYGKKKGLESYIIFPTTGCNARCIYCYEEGYDVKNMTPETADRLVDFICETRHDDTITLRWFGGEPLVKSNIISRICAALKERGIPYKSTMVTNASLMTKELAHEAKELWKLKRVQVSLDGAKEDYTPRKNYYAPEKHNYDVVMQAIHDLADEGIQVKLRVNVDFDNIERIGTFLDDIKTEFGDMKNVTLYLAPLFQVQHSEQCVELLKKILTFSKQISSMKTAKAFKDSGKMNFTLNYCMADSMDRSIVITPDGAFNNCEHLPDNHSWGNIFDGITNQALFEKLDKPVQIAEQCRKCPFLPQCTPFFKNGCPCWFEHCYEYQRLKAEYVLHCLLDNMDTEFEDDDKEI